MPAAGSRSTEGWNALCNNVRKSVPAELGDNAWEVIIAAALIASPEPQLLGDFYTHLKQNDPAFETEQEQKRLSLRLRDTILKLLTLVGSPQIICALMPLAKAEGHPEERAETSTLSPKWQNVDVEATRRRGKQMLDLTYGPLMPKIFSSWGDHTQDIQFVQTLSVYGLYLSDFEIMTMLEMEAVVFTTVSCTGLRRPSLWHTRGMGRLLGARGTDDNTPEINKIKNMLRGLKTGVMAIVDWVGEDFVRRSNLENWVNVGDVVRELGGWGDD